MDRSLIAHLPAFAAYDEPRLAELLAGARPIRYAKGAAAFEQGDEATHFFVLLNGRLRAVQLTPAGQQVVVRYVAPGEFFGVAVAIGMSAYPATISAVVDIVALAWPNARWAAVAEGFPEFVASVLKTVGSRLLEAHQRIVEMSTEAVERRVAHTLLRLVSQAGRKLERGVEIDFPISRQDVAEMAGTTLHTVSRILSAWEERGLVESGRRRIVIRNPHGLYELAESAPD